MMMMKKNTRKDQGFRLPWSVNRFGSSLKVNDGETSECASQWKKKIPHEKWLSKKSQTPTITGHRSGWLLSHHKERKKKRRRRRCFNTSPHISDRGGNEMNISTSFICFHFILLYLLVFDLFAEAPMGRLLFLLFFSVRLSITLSIYNRSLLHT
jgi:hypothetical protein